MEISTKIENLTRLIEHMKSCLLDLERDIDVSKYVITGAAEDNTIEWDF